jgi:hypothetical protein
MMTADWNAGGKAVLLPPGGGQVFGICGVFKNNKKPQTQPVQLSMTRGDQATRCRRPATQKVPHQSASGQARSMACTSWCCR